MSKYTVLSALKHDGKPYAEGDPIELVKKKAAPLLANGTIGGFVDTAKDEAEAEAKAEAEADALANADADSQDDASGE